MLIEHVINSTNEYIEKMPKAERKKYGQFFTSKESAVFMANLFTVQTGKTDLRILDAGAGSGILLCALIERILKFYEIKKIELTCYENDEKINELLKSNLEFMKSVIKTDLSYQIKKENYIFSQRMEFNGMLGSKANPAKYDMVIGNPPYKKIPKNALEAKSMPAVCYGSPNLYFLFAAMGLFNLESKGEMVYIIPRSWTSGAYFKKFRQYFLSRGKLKHIHLFESRDKVFDKENVLQETIIIKVQKSSIVPDTVTVTSSNSNNDFTELTEITVPYDLVVSGEEKYIYLVTNEREIEVLKKLKKWKDTLPGIGLRMKTGLTVDFRNKDILRNVEEKGAIPLFYAKHIRDGMVQFPVHKEYEYVVTEQQGLVQTNKNYLFVKRFTSKEEKRRLQCGIYLAKKYRQYSQISTQNKINFIEGIVNELSDFAVYGLYVVFNSTLYDKYYRILNGSTQVNSTEINNMPVPDFDTIQNMGRRLLMSNDLSEKNCNKILEVYCG